MSKVMLRLAALMVMIACVTGAKAQKTTLTWTEYDRLKREHQLPSSFDILLPEQKAADSKVKPAGKPKGGGGGFNNCNCWIQPDSSYTLAMTPNDDGSSGLITIPFQFDLYSDLYT
jgi:hypothetical protein